LSPDPSPRPVNFLVPPGAWDTHVHAIGAAERFPLLPDRSYTPAQVPIENYVALMDRLGIAHAVLVQPSIYGLDNSAMCDALTRYPQRFRGVAVVAPSIEDSALRELHDAGVRGIRANLLNRGGISFTAARKLAARIGGLGWHLQFQLDVSAFDEFDAIRTLPVKVVIDHMGHLPAAKGVDDPGFRSLLRLVGEGRCWVKLSAPYNLSKSSGATYEQVRPLAQALVAANPERVLWGSDWPHTNLYTAMPNDGDLLNLLGEWTGSTAITTRVLAQNPLSLYAQ
jgi:predicted TIM-barrel fold metal-dependent hydrolase